MVHPAWQELLPRLRQMLNAMGLSHIAIKEEADGPPLTFEQLLADYGTSNIYIDEFVTFAPVDPNWRVYRVQGAPPEEWIEKAKLMDFHPTPMISLSAEGEWEMCFGYDQGCLPADTFDDEAALLAALVDYLAEHFADRVYTLGVSVYPGGCCWGRIRERL